VTRASSVAIARALLAFVAVAILFHRPGLYLLASVLTIVAILMDGLDGWVARRYGEVSRLGVVGGIDRSLTRCSVRELRGWLNNDFGLVERKPLRRRQRSPSGTPTHVRSACT
jgi:hypothetical protein